MEAEEAEKLLQDDDYDEAEAEAEVEMETEMMTKHVDDDGGWKG